MADIDLVKIGRDIITNKDNPNKLNDIQLYLAGWYANYNHQMIELELEEATFWEKTKNYKAEKPLSDTMVRSLWKITKHGNRMIEVERTIKTIEKLLSTLRSSIARAESERRSNS